MTTGAAHWELLSRARAVDNQVSFLSLRSCSVLTFGPKPESLSRNPILQVYVATPSPARDTEAGYVAWGHSSVVK